VTDDNPIPAPWCDVEVIELDELTVFDPGPVLDQLQQRWSCRIPYVVRLLVPFSSPPSTVIRRDPWLLTPDLDLPRERLHHLVWSNAALATPNGSCTMPAAARLASSYLGSGRPQEGADAVMADGTPIVLDGGPLDLNLAAALTHGVVHLGANNAGSPRPLGAASPTADLAPDQLAAVAHHGGPARIVAPAGSGKTRVLTERARHLIRDREVPADALTLVAFNKRAQLEMEDRTGDLPGLRVRTLNALALSIVNGTDGFLRPSQISTRVETIDEREVRRHLRALVQIPRKTNTDPLAAWIEALGAARLGLRDPVAVVEEFGPDVADLPQVLDAYRERLRQHDQVDFDEQILRAVEVLLTDPASRSHAQSACGHLLVDEFQDLTPAHLLFVRLLAGPRADVFAVGDDDQTIYGFTGASPEWLVDFDRFFPSPTTYPLEINYRCPPAVVQGASHLLTHNDHRIDKTIRTPPDRQGSDDDLLVITTDEPLAALIQRVSTLIRLGTAPEDIVVLGRVNVALAAPQIALMDAGIPAVTTVGPDVLGRTGVRAMLAWLRLATDPGAMAAADLAEASRRPSRGLSAKVREWMGEHRRVADLRRLAKRLSEQDGKRINAFLDDVERLADLVQQGADTSEVLTMISEDIGVAGALTRLDGSRRSVDRSTHTDDVEALLQLGSVEPDPDTFADWLRTALGRPGAAPGQGVTLSTVHRVKGLEWPHVVVVGANEGTLPHRLADTEEERRVFHVALTRCRDTTTVVADARRPSRFLVELTQEAQQDTPPPDRPAEPAPSLAPTSAHDPLTADLLEALKAWRTETARAAGMPAYVVFGNATLEAIAEHRPTSQHALSAVKGVGPKKLEQYGDILLDIVRRTLRA